MRESPPRKQRAGARDRPTSRPLHRDHDAIVSKLRAVAARLSPQVVGSAFVASFDRAAGATVGAGALMNYAQVAHMPAHAHHGIPKRPDLCVECGFDDNEELDPEESAADAALGHGVPGSLGKPYDVLLRLEVLERALPLEPSSAARAAFLEVFRAIAALPPTAAEGQLRKALTQAGILPNVRARAEAIESLGAAGVLATAEHRGFFGQHVDIWKRQERPGPRVEADPPIAFWRARDGVHREAFHHWFGHLGLRAVPLRAPAVQQAATTGKAKARQAPVSEIEVGDVFAFPQKGGRWRVGLVVDFLPSKSAGPGPVTVFLQPTFPAPPPVEALADAPASAGRFCLYGLRQRVDRKRPPRYVHLGSSPRRGLAGPGTTISGIDEVERILARLR